MRIEIINQSGSIINLAGPEIIPEEEVRIAVIWKPQALEILRLLTRLSRIRCQAVAVPSHNRNESFLLTSVLLCWFRLASVAHICSAELWYLDSRKLNF